MQLWNYGSLSSKFKGFLFKFVHGRLYLNNVLANIDETHPSCTFCKMRLDNEEQYRDIDRRDQIYLNRLATLPQESVDHIFLECRETRQITRNIFTNRLRGGAFEEKKYMMGDYWTNSKEGITVRTLCYHYMKFQIYLCRIEKRFPSQQKIDFEITQFISDLSRNKKWRPFARTLMRQ